MMPIQKVVNIYKNSMDLKDKGASTFRSNSSGSEKNSYSSKDKASFQAILKKTMAK